MLKLKTTAKILKVFSFTLLLYALTFTLYASPVSAQSATLSLEPASGTFNKGCSFSVGVILDTGSTQTDGTDAVLFYDTARLTATTISNGSIYPDYPGNTIDAASGKIAILSLASVDSPFSGRGTLATVNFTVKDNATEGATQLSFDFDPQNKSKTTDSNVVQRGTLADVLNSVSNGSYTIGSGACGVKPGATPPAGQVGPGGSATPSARITPSPQPVFTPYPTLPPAGSEQLTAAIAIVGGILTVLGIVGLTFL